MESRRLKKNIVFTVAMLFLTLIVIIGMAYDFIPDRYNLASYLLIISTVLFALYGLFGVAENMQNSKREDIIDIIQQEKMNEAEPAEEVRTDIC